MKLHDSVTPFNFFLLIPHKERRGIVDLSVFGEVGAVVSNLSLLAFRIRLRLLKSF